MKRVLRFLRSPKLGLALVLGVAGYSILGTLVPQTSLGAEKVAAWSVAHPTLAAIVGPLGLFHAYSTPFFFAILGLLAASTSACAWSRSARSLGMWRAAGRVGEGLVERLKVRPRFVVAVPPDAEQPLEDASAALSGLWLKTRQGPRVVEAHSGRIGLLGSPLFHWSIVALVVLVALGQSTRSEGLLGVPVGSSEIDSASSYPFLAQGPLSLGQSGLSIGVTRIQPTVVVGGVDRGPSPDVRLSSPRGVLKDQLVYPNHPLRYGSLLIHRNNIGFAVPLALIAPDGSTVATDNALIDLEDNGIGLKAAGETLSGLPSGSLEVTIALVPTRGPQGQLIMRPALSNQLQITSSLTTGTSLASAPGSYRLPSGYELRFGRVSNYARLTVVRDWTVYGIYTVLILAIVGLILAMLVPYRAAWVLLIRSDTGSELRVVTAHSGRSLVFASKVGLAISQALAENARGEEPPAG